MKKFWYEGAYQDYRRATDFLNYPEVPFGPFIKEVVRPGDQVADVGSGFGVVTRYLAGLAREVVAIDQDAEALAYVDRDCAALGLDNVRTHVAIWPDVDLDPWDVTIAFYHCGFLQSDDQIRALARLTQREGLVLSQGPAGRRSFHAPILEALGQAPKDCQQACENGCYVRGRLDQHGFETTCQLVDHDFGQPVDDMAAAVDFMMNQMRLDEAFRPQVADLAPAYVRQEEGFIYVPITRSNCVIHFKKKNQG